MDQAEKERTVAAPIELGAVAAWVAPAVGIHARQLFRWRRQAIWSSASAAGFLRGGARVWSDTALALPAAQEAIEVELATARGCGPGPAVKALLAVLAQAKRRRP